LTAASTATASDAAHAQTENTTSATRVSLASRAPPPERISATVRAVPSKSVCISSHDGAAAAETAELVAESLGFRLINEDIVTRAALEAGVDTETVADVERRKSALVRLIEGLGSSGMGAAYVMSPPAPVQDQPASDALRGLIRSVIEDTAASGEVIIVSHAASLALADRDDVLRVLITASTDVRQRRFGEALGVEEKEAAKALKRSDAGRADYIKRFYGIDSEQPTHYDIVINTDKLTPHLAAQLIVTASAR
jgi:cytidylate kinase